jgi:hypothetical protein
MLMVMDNAFKCHQSLANVGIQIQHVIARTTIIFKYKVEKLKTCQSKKQKNL